MPTLYYKIKNSIDIESISDELAGFDAAIRVTSQAVIEVEFSRPISRELREKVDQAMMRMDAQPVAA